jgi:hypothetical protein
MTPPESPMPPPPESPMPPPPESPMPPPPLDLQGGPCPSYGFTGTLWHSPPESPVPPPPLDLQGGPCPSYGFTGIYEEVAPAPFEAPPPLNLKSCYSFGAAVCGGLNPIKKPLYYEPDEPPPSWTCSPISPGTNEEWLRARLEEAAIRADALAKAHNEFCAHVTPQSQRTPASVYGHRAGSPMPAMSPFVMTPRAEEDLSEDMGCLRLVIEERHDELQ